jgi:hypothetical protein
MATARQKSAARKNIRKSKARRAKTATTRTAARTKTAARSKSRTKTRVRTKVAKAKPRAKATARRRTKSSSRRRGFFHIEVQPKEAFVEFRTHDLGEGGIERVAGKRAGGSWSTQEWLIAKDQAHVERGTLVGDTVDARRVLTLLGTEPRHIKADRFTIHGHTGMPADISPTLAPRRAGLTNVQAPQKGRKWS